MKNIGAGHYIQNCIDDAIESALNYLSGHYMARSINLVSTNVFSVKIENSDYMYVTVVAEFFKAKNK